MPKQNQTYPLTGMYQTLIGQLAKRGVTPELIAKQAFEQQSKYDIPYSLDDFKGFVDVVLRQPNVLNLAVTGLSLDDCANRKELPRYLEDVLKADLPCYAVDEILAMGIANTFSPIGVTNFGNADCNKTAIARKLDEDRKHINVFADDIINGLVAAMAGYVINKLVEDRHD